MIVKGIERPDLSFAVRTTAFPGSGDVYRIPLVVEIPWNQIEEIGQDRGDGHAEIDLLAYVLDGSGTMWDLTTRRIDLDVEALRGSPAAGKPFRYYDLVWARTGDHEVRVLLRDAGIGRVSTLAVATPVPDLATEDFAVSGPVWVDFDRSGTTARGLDPENPPAHRRGGPVDYPFVIGDYEMSPMVEPRVAAGSAAHFMLVAHHLGTAPSRNELGFRLEATLIDALGQRHTVDEPRLVSAAPAPATGGAAAVIAVVIPETVTRGFHELEILVVATALGESLVRRLPLFVTTSLE